MKYKIVYDGRGRIRFRLRTLSRLLMKRIENNSEIAIGKCNF